MVVGATLDSISSNYFVLEGVPILVESIRKAVAVAFYAYHAFYTSYPIQSARLRVVLEKALFRMENVDDKQSLAILEYPEVRILIPILRV